MRIRNLRRLLPMREALAEMRVRRLQGKQEQLHQERLVRELRLEIRRRPRRTETLRTRW